MTVRAVDSAGTPFNIYAAPKMGNQPIVHIDDGASFTWEVTNTGGEPFGLGNVFRVEVDGALQPGVRPIGTKFAGVVRVHDILVQAGASQYVKREFVAQKNNCVREGVPTSDKTQVLGGNDGHVNCTTHACFGDKGDVASERSTSSGGAFPATCGAPHTASSRTALATSRGGDVRSRGHRRAPRGVRRAVLMAHECARRGSTLTHPSNRCQPDHVDGR